jgi:hypothetical protein
MSDKQSKRKWISFALLGQSSGLSYRCWAYRSSFLLFCI